MRILALETDIEKIKKRFLCEGESEVLTTHYHGASFLFASIREFFFTMFLFGIGVAAWFMNAPMGYTVAMLFVVWFVFVFVSLIKAYIDWCFDFIFVTSEKVILVDQTSIIRHKIKPINLENIGGVTAQTQFGDIFRFGIVEIHLKEGEGGETIALRFVPDAREVAAKISEVVTHYQRMHYPTRPEAKTHVTPVAV